MYRDFHAFDRWTKKQVHCIYQALIIAVATRHAVIGRLFDALPYDPPTQRIPIRFHEFVLMMTCHQRNRNRSEAKRRTIDKTNRKGLAHYGHHGSKRDTRWGSIKGWGSISYRGTLHSLKTF